MRLNLESGPHMVHSFGIPDFKWRVENGWSSHATWILNETFGCWCLIVLECFVIVVQWLLDDSCSFTILVTRCFQFVFVSKMSGWLLWPRGIWPFSPRVVFSQICFSPTAPGTRQFAGAAWARILGTRRFQSRPQHAAREVKCPSYPLSLRLSSSTIALSQQKNIGGCAPG